MYKNAARLEHRQFRHEQGDVLLFCQGNGLRFRLFSAHDADRLDIGDIGGPYCLGIRDPRDQDAVRVRTAEHVAHEVGAEAAVHLDLVDEIVPDQNLGLQED